VDGDEASGPQPQFRLIGLDDVEGSEPMSPLVFDKRAVGTVEGSRQSPQ
jgi:hypothetical protein